MLNHSAVIQENNGDRNLALSTIALVLFTSIHHIYGGALYNTSWRIIMPLFFFLPILALTLYLQYQSIRKSSTLLLAAFTVLAVMWIVGVGFYEGGYNHLLKNALYFGGASEEVITKMFPPEFGGTKLYEKPNDFLFESSGIATTLFSFVMIRYLVPFVKKQWERIN